MQARPEPGLAVREQDADIDASLSISDGMTLALAAKPAAVPAPAAVAVPKAITGKPIGTWIMAFTEKSRGKDVRLTYTLRLKADGPTAPASPPMPAPTRPRAVTRWRVAG